MSPYDEWRIRQAQLEEMGRDVVLAIWLENCEAAHAVIRTRTLEATK